MTGSDPAAEYWARKFLLMGSQATADVQTLVLRTRVGIDPEPLIDLFVDSERLSKLLGYTVQTSSTPGSEVDLGPAGVGFAIEYVKGSHTAFGLRFVEGPSDHYAVVSILAKSDDQGGSALTIYMQKVPTDCLDAVRTRWTETYLENVAQAYPPEDEDR
jgi:hypothetical protein